MSRFPCFIFRAPGAIARARYTYDSMAVTNAAQLDQRLASGWFLTLDEAIKSAGASAIPIRRVRPKPPRRPSKPLDGINRRMAKPVATDAVSKHAPESVLRAAPDDDAPVTREELAAKAKELGISFDGRTSNRKLIKLIEAALA